MVGDVTSVLDQLTKEASSHVWKELPWIEELRAVRLAQAQWTEKLARQQTHLSMLRPDDCLSSTPPLSLSSGPKISRRRWSEPLPPAGRRS